MPQVTARIQPTCSLWRARWRASAGGALAVMMALLALGLTACSSNASSAKPTALPLAQLHWCDHPSIIFQDGSSSSQQPLTKWDQVRDQLGFTLYLPKTLPAGSCLVVAGGSIHDSIYGGHVSMTYSLPDGTPLSFSEAPKPASFDSALQCTTNDSDKSTTVCLGATHNTSVTIASRQPESALKSLFSSLEPNVDWTPADTYKTPTPTATPAKK